MKKKKLIPAQSWIAILAAVLIVTITQVFPRKFTMQYLENGTLKTESFRGRKEFNERAQELRADSIKYWLDLER